MGCFFVYSREGNDVSGLANEIVKRIQFHQRSALVVTPLTLVCAIILYGRATGGVCLGKRSAKGTIKILPGGCSRQAKSKSCWNGYERKYWDVNTTWTGKVTEQNGRWVDMNEQLGIN